MYTVRIRREGNEFIARDMQRDWRTRCKIEGAPTAGRELAEHLFHREEIGDVRIVHGLTEVDILENSDAAAR